MSTVLARAAVDGAVFAALIWLIVRALPRLTPSTRALLWWAATAKFVIALAWITPLPLPVLPAPPVLPIDVTAVATPLAADYPTPASAPDPRADWTLMLIAAWAIGLCVSLGWSACRWLHRRRLVRDAAPADPAWQQMAGEIAAVLGIDRVPEVRISPATDSPFITGTRRPVVVVPPHLATLGEDQRRMTLCHELAHVKRGDLWLGLVPAAAERLFFFHPCARLAAREYAFWREVACDAAVITSLGTAPQAYGRLLLDLGVTPRRATLAPAGAAWSFSNMKRRIVMLHRPSAPTVLVRLAAIAVVALAAAGLVPFRLVARSADAMVVDVPAASEPATQDSSPQRLTFIYMTGDQTTMSGSTEDIHRARRLRKAGEDLLWFRRDGKEYVVRDPSILQAMSSIWAPVSVVGEEQSAIGAKQSAIGVQQSAIGVKQAEVGAQQAAVGARQSGVGARQAALAARQAARLSDSERAEIDRQLRRLDDEMRALDREMSALGDKMREFDQPMDDLGKDMDVLGREMDVLGKKMDAASRRADEEMVALIERALASGAAQPVR